MDKYVTSFYLWSIIIEDVKCHINGMQNVYVNSIRGEGNMVAHGLARFAKNVSEDMYWLEDSPPPVVDELYFDMLNLNDWNYAGLAYKKKKRQHSLYEKTRSFQQKTC